MPVLVRLLLIPREEQSLNEAHSDEEVTAFWHVEISKSPERDRALEGSILVVVVLGRVYFAHI